MPEKNVKDLEKLPLDKRLAEIKKIMNNKKKEVSEIENLYNKSIEQLSSKEKSKESYSKEEKPKTKDINLEEVASESKDKSKEENPLNEAAQIYQRLQSYGEMAKEGTMDYNAFNSANQLIQKLGELSAYVAVHNKKVPETEYQTSKQVETISSSSKRIFEDITSSYKGVVNDYRDINRI